MRERNPQERETEIDGQGAQELFKNMFPVGKDGKAHIPVTDTRTPAAVGSGLSPQEWKELRELNGLSANP